ncbi:MAG: hypothetical protein R3Y58_02055 [Eubacteriales bacterium]
MSTEKKKFTLYEELINDEERLRRVARCNALSEAAVLMAAKCSESIYEFNNTIDEIRGDRI